ncbi:MAG: YhfC family intramembrane metalloprotease [Sandaracinaceae bacterium]|nr:YhfC family intramembrane metalloprotease [Sandaracinaceae bacterium]
MAESSALVLAYVVEILVILGATLSLLGWLRSRTRVSYRIAALGALGFILSQVVHLPLNLGLGRLLPSAPGQLWISALALGLSAGLCEELTRYALLRTLAKGVRHEGSALMLGAGHGGIEALIIAGMATLGLVNLLVLGNDPSAFLSGLGPRERAEALVEIAALQDIPAFLPLVAALERLMVLPFHLAATLLVTLGVVRRDLRYVLAAVLFHALLDAPTVWLLWHHGGLAAEVWVFAMMVLSLTLLWALGRALPRVDTDATPRPEPSGAPVELVGASKRYGAHVLALRSASLSIEPGTRTCLLGPNGAGKTTAIRMLTGAIATSAGHAFLFGRESEDPDFLAAKRKLGVVPQLPGMYDDLSVRAWLELVRDLYGSGDLDVVAAELGLKPLLERPMGKLSGGQKRRVSVAAAVIAQPELLLLDEPTAGLDPVATREVLDYLSALSPAHTILLCTHDLAEAERLCDRVVVMSGGRVLVHEAIETLRGRVAPTLSLRLLQGGERAEAVLQAAGWSCTREGAAWVVPAPHPEADAPRVLRALLEAGVDVLECRVVRPTLEDLFLDIVASSTKPDPSAMTQGLDADVLSTLEPLSPPFPLRDLLGAATKRLMAKEWRQLRASGAAFWTSLLVPVLMLLLIPQTFVLAVANNPPEAPNEASPISFGLLADIVSDPTRLGVAFLPLFITLSALIAPTSLITHSIVQERETRTLELLVALPVRIQQVIAAKLATAYLAAMGVCGACLLVLCVELLVFGLADVLELLALVVLLASATAYATAASLLVALLAKDFRTANNLAGAVIGPAIVLVMVGMLVISGVVLRPLALSLLFALGALVIGRAALRAATFERLLE